MPGRSAPPSCDQVIPRWRSPSASVPAGCPGAGCTTNPAGLSITASQSSSYTTDSVTSGPSTGAGGD